MGMKTYEKKLTSVRLPPQLIDETKICGIPYKLNFTNIVEYFLTQYTEMDEKERKQLNYQISKHKKLNK